MNSLFDSDEPGNLKSTSSGSIISLVPKPEEMIEAIVDPETGTETPFILSTTLPESMAETVRKSGLAWSAGIAFFASVAIMLVIGWGADLLFGSSPWGTVGGIVLGSIIAFVQFFRITSQIFAPDKKMESGRMLLDDDDKQK